MNIPNKLKYGHLRGDGFRFSHYDDKGREHWKSSDAWDNCIKKARIRNRKRYQARSRELLNNLVTFDRVRKYGDIREFDGFRFDHYDKFGREHWLSPENWRKKKSPKIFARITMDDLLATYPPCNGGVLSF